MSAFAHARLLAPVLVLGVAACHDDAPTAPETAIPVPQAAMAAATAPLAFISITEGPTHTCAVTTDNRAFCWGDNSEGQLGDGTRTRRLLPHAVSGGLKFKVVSAGWFFTCGLTTADKAYCWGQNNDGTLGDGGSEVNRLKPSAVSGGRSYRQLRAGAHHVCAVTFGDVAYCWGDNFLGQLGVPRTTSSSGVPVKVVTGGPAFHRIIPGGAHTCALTTGQALYCWGADQAGQVGNGATPMFVATPTRVGGSRTFTQLGAGENHTCGVSGGKAYCWGSNVQGPLGDGTQMNRSVPTAVIGGLSFKGTDASASSTCGITTGNQAYCWGGNVAGQIGDGSFGSKNFKLKPTQVRGGLFFTTLGGSVIASHVCALTSAGKAYCWGDDSWGQIGNGVTNNSVPKPTAVLGPS
jgi:alpha-tubulin suppressor-like RCC1 family protein